jgi:hypothetical protein
MLLLATGHAAGEVGCTAMTVVLFLFYFFSSFQKNTIDWPITNILGTWGGYSAKVEAQKWNMLFHAFFALFFTLYIHES